MVAFLFLGLSERFLLLKRNELDSLQDVQLNSWKHDILINILKIWNNERHKKLNCRNPNNTFLKESEMTRPYTRTAYY